MKHPVSAPPRLSKKGKPLPLVADGRRIFLLGLILALLALAVFLPTLGNGFVNYDDNDYVTHNDVIQKGLTWEGVVWAFSASHYANWHPLTWLSHMLDCQIYGLDAWGHHLTSLLIHALNSVLVFLVLHRLSGSVWRSFLVAALFSVHPLRVESVAWISERKDVLSGMFFLLTLHAYASYVKEPGNEPDRRSVFPWRSKSYGTAWIFFCLGLMSKSMLVTVPFVLLLLDYWPLRRLSFSGPGAWPAIRTLVFEKIPFFAVTAVFCVITFLSQRAGGATAMISNLDLGPRLQNIGVSYCRYIGKLLWPSDLSVFYPFPPDWWPPYVVLLSFTALLAVSGAVLALHRKQGFLVVGWFSYLGMLVPVIGLVQVGEQSMADRYSYLPHLGLWIAAVWSVALLVQNSIWKRRIAVSVSVIVLACYVGLTRQQISYWKDGVTLFSHAKEVTPPYFSTRLSLGIALSEQKRYEEALSEYKQALQLRPDGAVIYHNMGSVYENLGRDQEALASYRRASSLDTSLKLSRLAVARLLAKSGAYDEAVREYQDFLRTDPEDVSARFFLGCVLVTQGKTKEAVSTFEEVIQRQPGHILARAQLARAWDASGDLEKARQEWQRVLGLQPANADANTQLAIVFVRTGHLDEAIPYFQQASRIEPDNPDFRYNLETALAQRAAKIPKS